VRATKLLALACALVLSASAAAAPPAWRVVHRIDSMTDRDIAQAMVTNQEGVSLAVYRHATPAAVWVTFRLPDGNADVLDHDKLIMLRIDKTAPIDVSGLRNWQRDFQVIAVESEPKWVQFSAAMADTVSYADRVPRLVRRLQSGSQVVVRYYLFTGGYQETTFPLAGAKHAIAEAVGVSESWDTAAADQADQLDAAKVAASDAHMWALHRCGDSAPQQCITRIGDCMRAMVTPDRRLQLVEDLESLSVPELATLAQCFSAVGR
jgi:hypothetical protein